MHDQMTIGMFQCSVSMRVSFVLRSAEETLEMIMHLVWFRHRNGLVTTPQLWGSWHQHQTHVYNLHTICCTFTLHALRLRCNECKSAACVLMDCMHHVWDFPTACIFVGMHAKHQVHAFQVTPHCMQVCISYSKVALKAFECV